MNTGAAALKMRACVRARTGRLRRLGRGPGYSNQYLETELTVRSTCIRFKLIVDDYDIFQPSLARIPCASTMAMKRRPRSA